jgi:hypothetical protein
MAANRRGVVLASGALLIATLALGGCSTTIADLPAVGTPADAPERPKEAGSYLPVHDLPPDRVDAVISPAERAKIEAELIAARERQATATETKDGKAKPEPKPDPKPAAKLKSGAKSEAKSQAKSRSKVEAKAE